MNPHLSFVNFFNADFTSGRTSLRSSLLSCRSRRRFGGHDSPAFFFCTSNKSMRVGRRFLSSVWGVGRLVILRSLILSNFRGRTRAKRSGVGCICLVFRMNTTKISRIVTDDDQWWWLARGTVTRVRKGVLAYQSPTAFKPCLYYWQYKEGWHYAVLHLRDCWLHFGGLVLVSLNRVPQAAHANDRSDIDSNLDHLKHTVFWTVPTCPGKMKQSLNSIRTSAVWACPTNISELIKVLADFLENICIAVGM